jgi:hypothetical protein
VAVEFEGLLMFVNYEELGAVLHFVVLILFLK